MLDSNENPMRLLGCVILFAVISLAQGLPVSPRHYLEIAASDVSAHMLWSQSLGVLESGETHAAFTALAVMDPMHPSQQLRGVRVDLSMADWKGVAYVQESEVPVMKGAADRLAKDAKEYPKETALFTAQSPTSDPMPPLFLWYQRSENKPTVYVRYLGGLEVRSLQFPGVPPSEVAAILARAVKALRAH
jgi:hypothetical protein